VVLVSVFSYDLYLYVGANDVNVNVSLHRDNNTPSPAGVRPNGSKTWGSWDRQFCNRTPWENDNPCKIHRGHHTCQRKHVTGDTLYRKGKS